MRFAAWMARLPLVHRRHLLRLVWSLRRPFRRDIGFGLEPLLAERLRIGMREATSIAAEHDFQDKLQQIEWLAMSLRRHDDVVTDSDRTLLSDPALVSRIADSGQTVILAPLHMGIFPMGVGYIIRTYFSGRRVLVLRAREDHEANNQAMARLKSVAGELRILNTHHQNEFMEAIRFARGGGVIVSLIDLPRSYGVPAAVTLFGMPASIALGIDAMARMLKAVVLPMAVHSDLSGDRILVGEPFEVTETTPDARADLARDLARQIENFVRFQPAQWHMWTRIGEFDPDPADAETTRGMANATA